MKKLFLILFLSVFCQQTTFAKDWPLNQLTKLYNENADKCLKRAARYIKLFPNKPVPYYFSAKIYNDRAASSKTSRKAYLNLNRAIASAKAFKKRSNDELNEKVAWDDFESKLIAELNHTYYLLKADKSNDLARNLKARANKVVVFKPVNSIEKEDEVIASNSQPEKASKPANVKPKHEEYKLYFGMPLGNENVLSFNENSELELLELINAERLRQGLRALVWEPNLARAARYHASDLAKQEYFDHQSFDRVDGELVEVGNTFDRIRKFYSATFVNSENIAGGNKSASGTYKQWYNSKGHYRNMFNATSQYVGIGVVYEPTSPYGYYWVFCTAR